jgi:hypothetical protein
MEEKRPIAAEEKCTFENRGELDSILYSWTGK